MPEIPEKYAQGDFDQLTFLSTVQNQIPNLKYLVMY